MNKIIFILIFLSSDLYADEVLNRLKEKPASQYQVGIVHLEFYAYLLTDNLKGSKVNGTSLTVRAISVEELRNKIYLNVKYIGELKDINKSTCEVVKKTYTKIFNTNNFAKKVWPSLNKSELGLLENEFLTRFTLLSNDKTKTTVSC